MSTEQNNRLSYEQPESYYSGYREPLSYGEMGNNDAFLSSHLASQPQQYEQQQKLLPDGRLLSGQKGKITPIHRLILAAISVGMIALFSMIVLTSTQNTSTGLIGVGIMCGSIFLVNLAFNRNE